MRRGRPNCRGARREDERGSLIVAVSIIMIVTTLVSVFAFTVIGDQLITLTRQNTDSGLAAADAGLSDALFQIDQLSASQYPPAAASPSFCVVPPGYSPVPPGCVTATVPGLGSNATASYVATYTSSSDSWSVQSMGTNRGRSAAVEESVTRSTQYPYAMFGNQGLSFNGRSAEGGFGSYTDGGQLLSDSSTINTTSPVMIGSNGTIDCNGTLPSNVNYWIWSGGGGLSQCPSATSVNTTSSTTLDHLPVPQTIPPGATPLPNNCNIGSENSVASLAAGTYYCTSTVTIHGNLSVPSGQVSIYIIVPTSDPAYTGTALDITSTVNPPPTPGINYDGTTTPYAQNLQIFSNSRGTVGDSSGPAYVFGGILDAPDASLVGNGCKSTYYGSLIINTLSCNGGPNLQVFYDNQLGKIMGPWQTTGYRQFSPKSFVP